MNSEMKLNFFQFIFQDWSANKGNPKGRSFMLLFRFANVCTTARAYFYIGIPYIIFYKLIVQWLFVLEIPWNVKIGRGLAVYHGIAIIINKDVQIGENCILRHSTTIGNKSKRDGTLSNSPRIGNYVDIGCHTCIIGDVVIGDNVKIGSGSVVIKGVPANCIVAGNPAREIGQSQQNRDFI